MAQWLVEGLTATISGVLTVFLVLILIALIISSLKYTYLLSPGYWRDKKKERAIKASAGQGASTLTKAQDEVLVEKQDDLELVAVITAAIASSIGTTSDRLLVKSIVRVNHTNRWNRR